ncbi:MAG: hypothetical protein VX379_06865 [Pseudomonadota bacterium]|uniref:hypothetical protein n=1 Tax=Alcanivorax sp. TaxID=1872427 RepID=UPI00243A2E39|nr:hypothetical protein [Alcanivorax sp.]MED5239279.1 hypothetical protein [Pseudomonadota bacterium]MEE3321930.1 hypothetical protein [Pseudomonadota bacterium]
MMNDLGIPEHLIWKLNEFDNHQRAVNFIKQFQDTLCVYSGPVEQLYTNYEISLPENDERSLIILPNPYAYHDTFNGIVEESVHASGMYIVPGDLFGKEGLFLTLRLLKSGKRVVKPVPLKVGLWALMKKETESVPFLPVITKGDLRAFRKDFPCLHLNRIMPSKLTDRSPMEIKAIQRVIRDKLQVYM